MMLYECRMKGRKKEHSETYVVVIVLKISAVEDEKGDNMRSEIMQQ